MQLSGLELVQEDCLSVMTHVRRSYFQTEYLIYCASPNSWHFLVLPWKSIGYFSSLICSYESYCLLPQSVLKYAVDRNFEITTSFPWISGKYLMFESLIASAAPLKVEIKFVYVKEYSVVFNFFFLLFASSTIFTSSGPRFSWNVMQEQVMHRYVTSQKRL